jgi:hypothetical protein
MKKRLHAPWLTCFILITLGSLLSAESFSQSLVLGNEKTKVEVGINVGPSFFWEIWEVTVVRAQHLSKT